MAHRLGWDDREQVLLEAVADAEAEDGDEPNTAGLAERTGLPLKQVQVGLRNLYGTGYITGFDVTAAEDLFDLINVRLLERGYRTVRQWPTENRVTELLAVIDAQADAATTRRNSPGCESSARVSVVSGRRPLSNYWPLI